MTIEMPEFAAPTVRFHEVDVRPRIAVGVTLIKQRIEAQAFGSPGEARRLGAAAVDAHEEDLQRLSDS